MDEIEQLRKDILGIASDLDQVEAGTMSKAAVRNLHLPATRIKLRKHQKWIRKNYPRLSEYFADGDEINPVSVDPALIEVTEPWQASLFRLARLTWSLPYTKGYGRRLRFILIDRSNDKLIGILGLQSPPLDFPARDQLFEYPATEKVELINQTMDIFTLGAVPPYNRLLGGKLVALAAASDEVRAAYRWKYQGRKTEIAKRELPSRLVALTTTSAFGRSSIYNRLKFSDRLVAQPIGYTEGFGTFHLASLLPKLQRFLQSEGVSTYGGFGVGPRITWQTCIRALDRLGISRDMLNHGIKREVFIFPLIENLTSFMEGRSKRPRYFHQEFEVMSEWWIKRWLLPRSARVDGWHFWKRSELEDILVLDSEQNNG